MNTAMQSDLDVYYTVIERKVMETRYPLAHRTFVKLKGIEACGGDINVLRTTLVHGRQELWDRIIAARKNPFKQVSMIGYGTLILFLLRRLTLEQAVERATKRLKISGQALICPYAETGMDVDKPEQLEMMRADLAGCGQNEPAA